MDSKTSSDRTTQLRQGTVQILKAFTRRQKSAEVPFSAFAEYAEKYVAHYRAEYPQLEAFGTHVKAAVREAVADLVKSGQCKVKLNGEELEQIDFPLFYAEAVRDEFKRAEASPDAPFPSEAGLGIAIPNELVTTTNAGPDMLQSADATTPLVRVLFLEGLRSIVVPTETVRSRLLDFSLARLKHHLGQANNAAYVQSRMAPAYHGNKTLVSEMIAAIAMRSGNARQTIENASDADFRFWAHLTHVIIQEKRGTDDMRAESAFQQAALIINAYAVGLRSAGQNKQNEARAALKTLEAHFSKEPFVYTFKDLLGLKEPGGGSIIRKDNHDAFVQFLKEKLRPPTGKLVPELVRLKTEDGTEHYVHRERLIPILLRSIRTVAEETEYALADAWEQSLRAGRKEPGMLSEDAFGAEVRRVCCSDHPLFCRLLDEGLLNAVQRETNLPASAALELSKCFDHRGAKLKPLPEILSLDRSQLAARVRAAVPLWARVAVLRAIVMFFRSLGSGRGRDTGAAARQEQQTRRTTPQRRPDRAGSREQGEDAGSTTVKRLADPSDEARPAGRPATLKQRNAAYRKDLERLRDQFVTSGKSLPQSLEELADKWNPLFDPKARTDLKQDVDSMVRTFLRGILRKSGSMKPPDSARIASLAQRLAGNPAFDRVRHKDLLMRYMELMMIKVLADDQQIRL